MREKQNLGIAALIAFDLLFAGFFVLNSKIFVGYAGDYLSFWSGAHIASAQGYELVYQQDVMDQVQRSAVDVDDRLQESFTPLPIVFLPIFVWALKFLDWFSPANGYWIWTILNVLGLVGYLAFLQRAWVGKIDWRLIMLLMLSYPVLANFIEGQVNVWLVIFVGEFIRSWQMKRPYLSGLWLAALLIKPQSVILLVPMLLVLRAWKVFFGFTLGGLLLLLLSIFVGGAQSVIQLASMWRSFAGGLRSVSPENMMNWRMLGVHLENLGWPLWGWVMVILGMTLTAVLCSNLWRSLNGGPNYAQPANEKIFAWVIFGTLVATCAFTWHAHLHMSMIQIPAMIYLCALGEFEDRLLNLWVFLLPATLLLTLFLGIMTHNPFILQSGQPGGFLLGLAGLFLNMFLLVVSRNRASALVRIS